MAKKKEATTEEEMIAELQKQIDAYNKKMGGGKKYIPRNPKPDPSRQKRPIKDMPVGTDAPKRPKQPKPGTTTASPTNGKKYIPRTPVKTPKPGDGMKYIPRTPGKK
jgi:hypothetical protein